MSLAQRWNWGASSFLRLPFDKSLERFLSQAIRVFPQGRS
jgi:hypothetical protein